MVASHRKIATFGVLPLVKPVTKLHVFKIAPGNRGCQRSKAHRIVSHITSMEYFGADSNLFYHISYDRETDQMLQHSEELSTEALLCLVAQHDEVPMTLGDHPHADFIVIGNQDYTPYELFCQETYLSPQSESQPQQLQAKPFVANSRRIPNSRGRRAAKDLNPMRKYVCTFPGCNDSFLRHDHLRRHQVAHTRERPFGCAACGKFFSRKDNLNIHLRSMHRSC